MKAISIRQPWAWAVIHASKDVENRSWRTAHRGDLLVHASSKIDRDAWEWIYRRTGILVPPIEQLERGAVIGIVRLVDVRENRETDSRWRMNDRYCWLLDQPRALARPIPLAGKQQVFEVPTAATRGRLRIRRGVPA